MWRSRGRQRHRRSRGRRRGMMRGRLNRRWSAGFCWLVRGEKQVDPCRWTDGRLNAECHDRHRRLLALAVRSHRGLHRQLCHSWTLLLLARFRRTRPSHRTLQHLLRGRPLRDN